MTEPATFATPTRERTGTPLLSVRDLSVTFPQRDGDGDDGLVVAVAHLSPGAPSRRA